MVSVITATLNAVEPLTRTLDSVSAQTYRCLEHLVIDGGSTDGTVALLTGRQSQLAYWISEPDQGIYEALNKGIRAAKGDWLYFLGAGDAFADDLVLDDLFRVPPKADFLYGDVLWGDTGRRYEGRFSKWKLIRKNICHQAIFYHRGLFDRLGLFDTRYPLCADWAFNMKCFGALGVRVQHVDRVVARYDTSGASSSVVDAKFETCRAGLVGALGPHYALLYRIQRALRHGSGP